MKTFFALVAAALLAMPFSAHAWAPKGDVNVIVAYKAGSGTDQRRRNGRLMTPC